MSTTDFTQFPPIAFIGGGNMASAIIGGLIRQGVPATHIIVVEPYEPQRAVLLQQFGIQALPAADDSLSNAQVVVWAVKPQTFKDAASSVAAFTAHALHLSVAAGIRSSSIAQWTANDAIVRAMPNTPALVGQGMTALFARAGVTAAQQALAEQIIGTTGQLLWVQKEEQLDAVTALSGSGPAYVFYFLEAMQQAGVEMGLPAEQALQLAIGTFSGASQLADRHLVERLEGLLDTFKVAPRRLVLELAEPVIALASDDSLRRLEALHRLGCRLAIDGFGRGWLTWSRIRELPLRELKLPISSPAGIGQAARLAGFARQQGLSVTATRIETREQWRDAVRAPFQAFQGHLIGRPAASTGLMMAQLAHPNIERSDNGTFR